MILKYHLSGQMIDKVLNIQYIKHLLNFHIILKKLKIWEY